MTFRSHSQAGQDLFVHALIPDRAGTFLDVGCGHPTTINNTAALERIGWSGLLVDNSFEAVEACKLLRDSPVVHGDAVGLDWTDALNSNLPAWRRKAIDFLSLDIDEASADALNAILNAGARFNIICAEHDAYRHGDLLRAPMRQRLLEDDYYLVCANVCSADGQPYEDWFVSDALSDAAMRFRCEGLKWADVLKLGGAL